MAGGTRDSSLSAEGVGISAIEEDSSVSAATHKACCGHRSSVDTDFRVNYCQILFNTPPAFGRCNKIAVSPRPHWKIPIPGDHLWYLWFSEVCKLPWLVWEKLKWLLHSLCSLRHGYNGLAQYEMQLAAPDTGYYPRLEITHCAAFFLSDTEALPEKEAASLETLTLFGQRLIFSSVSFRAMAYSFTSSDTPTI